MPNAPLPAGSGSSERNLYEERAGAYENSRPEVRRHVPSTARRILDLGCASGIVGATLKEAQSREVVGVEFDPVYAERAEHRLDQVVLADVEELAADEGRVDELGNFDCLLAGDILEHLRDPWTALRRFGRSVDRGGTVIVSVPNVRHWLTFWELGARGAWPRHAEGIFDRDHLRWFTRADGVGLLEDAGFRVELIEPIYRLGKDISPRDRWARRIGRTPLREFVTFQLILVGRREA